ncbi:MAG: GNAT family N-acetyltransferase [Acidobacteriota bacterium]|nr:MAG: GNAT family N-acetyltransferase [Acidobacteriota bacterium]
MVWKIRKARAEDSAAVKMIEREAGLSEWTEADYRNEAVREGSVFLIASGPEGIPIAGFLVMRLITNQVKADEPDGSSFEAEILNLAVRKKFLRMGIGKSLVSSAVSELRKSGKGVLHLEVRSRNRSAVSFYERLGFRICGRRARFYATPPDDAILMSRRI